MASRIFTRLCRFDRREKETLPGLIGGVDEAGCAPLAGPVVAAAVILLRHEPLDGINDSKQVAAAKREKLFYQIAQNALVGIGVASEAEIDELNIYHANCLAMRRAVLSLTRTPDLLLVDGNRKINLPVPQKRIIGGDAKSACIAAASIMAKVYRDSWMRHLDTLYPGYNFSKHKGYGTREHLQNLKVLGPCQIHRKSFAPVRLAAAGMLMPEEAPESAEIMAGNDECSDTLSSAAPDVAV